VHLWATVALVMAPIRASLTLAMVLEWKEPSSVTLHLTVIIGVTNSSAVQLVLMLDSLVESLPADAVEMALASTTAAASAVKTSFADVRIADPFGGFPSLAGTGTVVCGPRAPAVREPCSPT
jgi:hypothetical protein